MKWKVLNPQESKKTEMLKMAVSTVYSFTTRVLKPVLQHLQASV